jgi:branched-chain amino acid transport system permease protein
VVDWTAFVFFIVIIGGIATLEGPILGVIIFWLVQDQLAAFGAWYLMILGALAVAVMLFFPKGLWGTFADRYDLHLFPIRRRLIFEGSETKS